RVLNPRLQRFNQRDPLGYPDGMNTYAAYHILHGTLDPDGLKKCCGGKEKPKKSSGGILGTPFFDQNSGGGWFNEKWKCCGDEKTGDWYLPDEKCCEDGKAVEKVSVWR